MDIIKFTMNTLKKNDIVRFLPEYQDGENEFDYILIEDPDGGRVKVQPINNGLEIPPIYVVEAKWLKMKSPDSDIVKGHSAKMIIHAVCSSEFLIEGFV